MPNKEDIARKLDIARVDLLGLIRTDVALVRAGGTDGGEYCGPCPFCGGEDRFRVWPADDRRADRRGKFWCRQCGKQGDALDYLQARDGVSFEVAQEQLFGNNGRQAVRRAVETAAAANGSTEEEPPYYGDTWAARASQVIEDSEYALWSPEGERALSWLHARGFTDDVLQRARIGYNPTDRDDGRDQWGLVGGKTPWLSRGITLPYFSGGACLRIQIRRPVGEPKYSTITGSQNIPWNFDAVDGAKPVVVTEGVFNALTVLQHAGDLCVAVATGGTSLAREARWVSRLKAAPVVLVAFDADMPGDKASEWWINRLDRATRWRPAWGDLNDMALGGVDLRVRIARACVGI